MRRIAVAALTALLALGLAPAAGAAGVAATASSPARATSDGQTYGGCLGVTIVVDHGDLDGDGQRGGVVQCEPTTGRALDVLQAAGVKLEGTASMGLAFVCRVEGRPAADEVIALPDGSTRTESCQRTPPANAYWSLWVATWDSQADEWTYATSGVGDIQLGARDAIALVYAVGRDEGLPPLMAPEKARWLELPSGWEGRVPAGDVNGDGDGPAVAVYAGGALLLVLVGAAVVLAARRRRRR